jgi:AraC family transcriptional regulator of arabinose operon
MLSMKINTIGINYTHSGKFSINRPCGSGDYLLLNIKTPAILLLNGKEVIAEKNSVIIYKKGSPQIYRAKEATYTNDYIHFDMNGEHDIVNLPFDTVLSLPSNKEVSKLIKELYLEYISNNTLREESMELLMRLLFVKVYELAAYPSKDTRIYGYYDDLLNLRSMIYRHPEEKWSVTRMANHLNLSPSYFQRLYRQTFHVTCNSDVIQSKLQFAKTALVATSDTVRKNRFPMRL